MTKCKIKGSDEIKELVKNGAVIPKNRKDLEWQDMSKTMCKHVGDEFHVLIISETVAVVIEKKAGKNYYGRLLYDLDDNVRISKIPNGKDYARTGSKNIEEAKYVILSALHDKLFDLYNNEKAKIDNYQRLATVLFDAKRHVK